jgi:hypothetical protein
MVNALHFHTKIGTSLESIVSKMKTWLENRFCNSQHRYHYHPIVTCLPAKKLGMFTIHIFLISLFFLQTNNKWLDKCWIIFTYHECIAAVWANNKYLWVASVSNVECSRLKPLTEGMPSEARDKELYTNVCMACKNGFEDSRQRPPYQMMTLF